VCLGGLKVLTVMKKTASLSAGGRYQSNHKKPSTRMNGINGLPRKTYNSFQNACPTTSEVNQKWQ
jgi:hypothetical protein